MVFVWSGISQLICGFLSCDKPIPVLSYLFMSQLSHTKDCRCCIGIMIPGDMLAESFFTLQLMQDKSFKTRIVQWKVRNAWN